MSESTDNTTAQPLDVEALAALEKAATPAPWKADTNTRGDCVVWGPDGQFVMNAQAEPHWLPAADGSRRAVAFDVDRRDVELIAAMRNQLPALLSELANARVLIEGYGELLEAATAKAATHFRESVQSTNERDTARREAEQARADALRWAADRIDPGPSATWPTPRSETWEISMSARRGVAANLRTWADATPGGVGPGSCTPGPWETYDPIAVLDEAISASGVRVTFDPRHIIAAHTHRGPKATDPDRQHPAHVGQTCEEYEAAGAGDAYFCPTSGEVESPTHGGFDVCCDAPELHRAAGAGDGEQDATTGPAYFNIIAASKGENPWSNTPPAAAAPDADSGETADGEVGR